MASYPSIYISIDLRLTIHSEDIDFKKILNKFLKLVVNEIITSGDYVCMRSILLFTTKL